ncbi:MAG: glycosyl hydrolase 53 family protein [Bacteroidaceae bacterium]|nr:glycosyl hydrolase 53 family protein [Bacteroidaceae bacterium]
MNPSRYFCHVFFLLALCVGSDVTAQSRLLGADLSMLPAYEQANVPYKDANGNVQNDPLLFFRDAAGIRCVRLRLFVQPTGETGVIQDLDFVTTFARRIKQAGMKVMLDFHYSDTWADPSQQKRPASWPAENEAACQQLYRYTTDCLATLNAAGATPDYIQIGNEISYGMCGIAVHTGSDQNWDTFRSFLTSAAKACREQAPKAKIIIHTERAGQWSVTKNFYDRISTIDYDIIGLSYYPFWHNSISVLGTTLSNLATNFPDKEVMIVEYAYYNAWYPSDAKYNFTSTYPATPAGQQKFTEDLIAELLRHANVSGLFYWMPEENPYGNRVYEPWQNRGLFNNGYGNEWTNGNRALPAFYSLKKFTEGQPDHLSEVKASSSSSITYDLTGKPASRHVHGIVIRQGRKTLY